MTLMFNIKFRPNSFLILIQSGFLINPSVVIVPATTFFLNFRDLKIWFSWEFWIIIFFHVLTFWPFFFHFRVQKSLFCSLKIFFILYHKNKKNKFKNYWQWIDETRHELKEKHLFKVVPKDFVTALYRYLSRFFSMLMTLYCTSLTNLTTNAWTRQHCLSAPTCCGPAARR